MKSFTNSIVAAFRGFLFALNHERNFRIELYGAAAVIFLIFLFDIKSWQAIILILLIMLVLAMELVNTVVERVVDILKPRVHPYARVIKDLMASVVLLSSITALIVGAMIFHPYVRDLIV